LLQFGLVENYPLYAVLVSIYHVIRRCMLSLRPNVLVLPLARADTSDLCLQGIACGLAAYTPIKHLASAADIA
jgi:hypothetical protein